MSEFIEPGQGRHASYGIKTACTVLKDPAYDQEDLTLETGMVVLNLGEDDELEFVTGLSETTDSFFRFQSSEDQIHHSPVYDLGDEVRPGLETSQTLQNWIPMTEEVETCEVLDEFVDYVMIDNIQPILEELRSTGGFIAAALVDATSGMMMGSVTGATDFDIEVAAAVNTGVVKAKMKAIEALNLDEQIEDILISLDSQYHLIRPLKCEPYIFVYLAVDRRQANLALCRMAMALTEEKLAV